MSRFYTMNDKNLLNAYKPFNIKNKRPQVLLLGNGLNYMSSSKISWDDFIGYKTTPENVKFRSFLSVRRSNSDIHVRRGAFLPRLRSV